MPLGTSGGDSHLERRRQVAYIAASTEQAVRTPPGVRWPSRIIRTPVVARFLVLLNPTPYPRGEATSAEDLIDGKVEARVLVHSAAGRPG